MTDLRSPTHLHAQRVDTILRRLRHALEPIRDSLEACGRVKDACTTVAASPKVWAELDQALRDAEPWPLELQGPVMVLWRLDEDTGPTPYRGGWFTRGHHDPEAFVAFAKRAGRAAGLTLLERPGRATQQCVQMWFRQTTDQGTGRPTFVPGAPSYEPDAVPVTVWFPAETGS